MLGRQTEWMWAATAAAALALAPPWTEPARGQVAGGASGQNAGPVDDPPRMLAERLLTLVDDALEGKGQPRTDQLVRARILLEQALKLAPDDAESWRLRLELADRLDDKAGSFDALKAYCRLRPEDDVAQWDLIQRSINQKQTIEQRTTAVANLADGTSAGGLSPALRSRLATYLARAASERGDNREFALRLKAALQLDPANPRAAAMAYELTLARQAPPLDRGATLLAVVRSAPTDSMARWQLGNILLSQGAYLDAVGQLAAAKSVSTSPFSPQEATNYYASMVISLASAGQTAQALALLNQLDAAWSPAAPGATTAPAATAPAVKPESAPATAPSDAAPSAPTIGAGLPIDLEILRVALLKRDGGFERAAASLTRVREDVARRAKRPGPEGAMAQTEQAWIDLLFFNEGDTAAAAKALQALPALVEKTPADQPLGKRLRGFLSLRAGRVEEARAALIQLIATDPFACYGMGHSYPAESRERREWLAKSAESGASGLSGLLSCLELRALGFPVTATPAGLAVGDRLAEWPRLLVNPNPAEQAWIILALTVEPHRSKYLEPIRAVLRIRNATDIPMSMGPEGTVPTRVFLLSTIRPGQTGKSELPPRVVDVHRRLRLDGRQSLDVPVRLDRGMLGALLTAAGTETIQLNTLAMLDPYPTANGRYSAGPLGAADMARLIERQGVPANAANVAGWLEALSAPADPAVRLKALALIPEAVRTAGTSPEAAETSAKLTKALIDVFPKLDPAAQAWALTFLPEPDKAAPEKDAFKTIHETAERSGDVLVKMVDLATAVRDPKSPMLNAALRSDNRTLVEFAQALRQGLETAASKPAEAKP